MRRCAPRSPPRHHSANMHREPGGLAITSDSKPPLSRAERSPGLFAAFSERRYAKRASRELLELLHAEQRAHPELKGRPLYEPLIARRLGPGGASRAPQIV